MGEISRPAEIVPPDFAVFEEQEIELHVHLSAHEEADPTSLMYSQVQYLPVSVDGDFEHLMNQQRSQLIQLLGHVLQYRQHFWLHRPGQASDIDR